ncbi:MAG: peptidoglycan-associated lipoprotein Pal [Thiotrichales bacterium]|nr:peptidoglycan-associated lipoprotein Pal [Thiotrichales bacterium]
MSLNHLTKLFTAGLLATAMVGCSSTPKTEEGADNTSADVMEKAVVETAIAQPNENADAVDLDSMKAMLASKVVRFEFDRSEVTSEFYDTINAHADYMMANSSANVLISGHCDERGTREYNLALGERRANAVKDALIAKGISPNRIDVVSFGEDNPVAMGHNESAWSQNRRAEFKY